MTTRKQTAHKPATRTVAAHERAAARVAAILADPETPDYLMETLTDMLIDLTNETRIDVTVPEVARVALPLMFAVTEATELMPTYESGTVDRDTARYLGSEVTH